MFYFPFTINNIFNYRIQKFQLALDDANKCLELDSNWIKGITRKGDALFSLKKFTDAHNAYNSGKILLF